MTNSTPNELDDLRALRRQMAFAGSVFGYFLPGIVFVTFTTLTAPIMAMGLSLGLMSACMFYLADILARNIVLQRHLPNTLIKHRLPKETETGTPLAAFGRHLFWGAAWASPVGGLIKAPTLLIQGLHGLIRKLTAAPAPGRYSPLQKLFIDPDKPTKEAPRSRVIRLRGTEAEKKPALQNAVVEKATQTRSLTIRSTTPSP